MAPVGARRSSFPAGGGRERSPGGRRLRPRRVRRRPRATLVVSEREAEGRRLPRLETDLRERNRELGVDRLRAGARRISNLDARRNGGAGRPGTPLGGE